jgi:uncharacterized protein
MSLTSRIIEWLCKLPPAETRDVEVDRDLAVPMPDGAVLLADRHYARGREKAPTLLVRTPYGRAAPWEMLFGTPFAERGFQVVIQSCRGTFGSGGAFDPLRNEREDGLATIAWLKEQPWFSGEMAMLGPSYLGFVQWAIAAEAGPELKAMVTHVTSSNMRSSMYSGGSFWLETALVWAYLVSIQEKSLLATMLANLGLQGDVGAAARTLPLRRADEALLQEPAPFLRDWLSHDQPGDPFWEPVDFSEKVAHVSAPVQMLGGWYDVFLPQTIADHARLRRAGKTPHLTIGPWFHTDQRWFPTGLRDALAWFRAHLLGDPSGLREAPVRVYVMGEDAWREFPDWPPPDHRPERWYLQAARGLSPEPPAASDPDTYRYDPADPTPSVGGSTLAPTAGAKDNRALEARPDVLVYTSAALDRDVVAIGPVKADLYVQSSLAHTDFFARLCDVLPSGKSINVSDGLLRLSPGRPEAGEGGVRKVEIELWPTGYRWKRGHRVRLQVSSGAHPRHARNPGSGEPLGTATTLRIAEQRVYHEPGRASAIWLPIVD